MDIYIKIANCISIYIYIIIEVNVYIYIYTYINICVYIWDLQPCADPLFRGQVLMVYVYTILYLSKKKQHAHSMIRQILGKHAVGLCRWK